MVCINNNSEQILFSLFDCFVKYLSSYITLFLNMKGDLINFSEQTMSSPKFFLKYSKKCFLFYYFRNIVKMLTKIYSYWKYWGIFNQYSSNIWTLNFSDSKNILSKRSYWDILKILSIRYSNLNIHKIIKGYTKNIPEILLMEYSYSNIQK